MQDLITIPEASRRLSMDIAIMRDLARRKILTSMSVGDGRTRQVVAEEIEGMALLLALGLPALTAAKVAGKVRVEAGAGGVTLRPRPEVAPAEG